jgi:tRNA pseudouridine38-40 synthase
MTRYKLSIEYCGTGTHGWQRQPEDVTLQQILEIALKKLTNENVVTVASGRTDAGVHALAQVVHFDLQKDFDSFKILTGLNHYLVSKPISVLSSEKVSDDFHARFSATKRYYRYIILNRRAPSPLNKKRMWHVVNKLDISLMREAAKHLIGIHDFSSFRASECQSKNPVKTLDYINITLNDEQIIFDISGPSFLHHQCRNIVGTLKEVGEGKISPNDIPEILKSKKRSEAGVTAPAHGLYFVKVDY